MDSKFRVYYRDLIYHHIFTAHNTAARPPFEGFLPMPAPPPPKHVPLRPPLEPIFHLQIRVFLFRLSKKRRKQMNWKRASKRNEKWHFIAFWHTNDSEVTFVFKQKIRFFLCNLLKLLTRKHSFKKKKRPPALI